MIIALTIIAWSAVVAASILSIVGIALMVRGYLDVRAMRRAELARKRLERAGVTVLADRSAQLKRIERSAWVRPKVDPLLVRGLE